MIVASVLIVLPVAGPVALITYIVLKKLGHDSKKGQLIHTTIKMIYREKKTTKATTNNACVQTQSAFSLITVPCVTYFMYCVRMLCASVAVEIKWWYRILMVFGICLKVIGILLWLVQAGYSATQGTDVHTLTHCIQYIFTS